MKIKQQYCLCPDYVVSKNDGQRHFIGIIKLAELYKVNLKDCITTTIDSYPPKGINENSIIYLMPDDSGEYELPLLSYYEGFKDEKNINTG